MQELEKLYAEHQAARRQREEDEAIRRLVSQKRRNSKFQRKIHEDVERQLEKLPMPKIREELRRERLQGFLPPVETPPPPSNVELVRHSTLRRRARIEPPTMIKTDRKGNIQVIYLVGSPIPLHDPFISIPRPDPSRLYRSMDSKR